MARAAVGVALAAGVALVLSGCGTMFNMRGPDDPSNESYADIMPRESVYGGVRLGAMQTWAMTFGLLVEPDVPLVLGVAAEVDSLPYTFLGLVDLPLSAVADTLTLPWTIHAELTRSVQTSDRPAPPGPLGSRISTRGEAAKPSPE